VLNENFKIKRKRPQALETTEEDLISEERQADELNKLEESDVRRINNLRRNDPITFFLFHQGNLQTLAKRIMKDDNALITKFAMREFAEHMIEWTERVVRDAIIIEGESRLLSRCNSGGYLQTESVLGALSYHGFSPEAIEQMRSKKGGNFQSPNEEEDDNGESDDSSNSELEDEEESTQSSTNVSRDTWPSQSVYSSGDLDDLQPVSSDEVEGVDSDGENFGFDDGLMREYMTKEEQDALRTADKSSSDDGLEEFDSSDFVVDDTIIGGNVEKDTRT
jgi:hypothetical protein